MATFNNKDKELLIRVNEVLHYLWDPIGVSGVPAARDEYDSYGPQIFSLLKKRVSNSAIAEHLTKIAMDRMGLNENQKHDFETAKVLMDWMDFYAEKGS